MCFTLVQNLCHKSHNVWISIRRKRLCDETGELSNPICLKFYWSGAWSVWCRAELLQLDVGLLVVVVRRRRRRKKDEEEEKEEEGEDLA